MKQHNKTLSKRWFALVLAGLFIASCAITLLPWRIMAESPDTDEGISDVSTTSGPVDSATGEHVFDPQPTSLEDVQAAIDKYNAATEGEGTGAGDNSLKPHWQDEVDTSFMPEGYSCQLVEDDSSFTATYYTFFIVEESSQAGGTSSLIAPSSAALGIRAAGLGYGSGSYKVAPPGGEAVSNYFNIISGQVDTTYKNVVIITNDVKNDYGAMWSKQKLDLTQPFETEIYLYINHKEGTNGEVADGMTFVMQNDSLGMNAIGGLGEGLGVYKGRKSAGTNTDGTPKTVEDGRLLNNMLAIELDTYYNTQADSSLVQDPTKYNTSTPYHCAVVESSKVSNKDKLSAADHKNDFQFSISTSWKQFMASWNPDATKTGGTLTYSYDGVEKTYTVTSNQTTFGGNMVYWGFTGTTGGIASLQAAAIVSLPIPNVTVTKSVSNSSNTNINGGVANEGERLTYKVRTYVNQGEKLSPIKITDKLSEYVDYAGGDVLVTTSNATKPSFYVTPSFAGQVMTVDTGHELTAVGDWIEITFDVIVKKNLGGIVVANEAEVSASNLNPQKSNETRVTVPAVALSANKSARVSPDGAVDNGTAESPVSVNVGDLIEYSINVDSSANIAGDNEKYDIVFVLNWSDIMNPSYTTGGERANNMAKKTIQDVSQRLFSDYPGSRIAVMGMNSSYVNTYDPKYTYLQYDTDFAGPYEYEDIIQKALTEVPAYAGHDAPIYLRAATDKLTGDKSTLYGTSLSPTTRQKYVNARQDKSRTPVVVLISDYQLSTLANWNSLYAEADRFKQLLPDGILITVRTDHLNNLSTTYSSSVANDRMDVAIAKGDGRWAWTKFTKAQSQEQQNDEMWRLLSDYVHVDVKTSATITDILPKGLEYVRSTQGGELGADGRTVTWDINALDEGDSTVTVTAKVKETGTFINDAAINIEGYDAIVTNKTYHIAEPTSATKTARVLPNGAVDNGTAEKPVSVKAGDEIEYNIDVNNTVTKPSVSNTEYDIVFVLDWSGSMHTTYVYGGTGAGGVSARNMAKETIRDMSQRLFANYPNSRIAVMGMNCSVNNAHVPLYTYLQFDSNFVGPDQYESVIRAAFEEDSPYLEDDDPIFLQAATDKLAGNTTTIYGSSLSNAAHRLRVNARQDKSRTPVVVLISDFQLNATASWTAFYNAVDRFKSQLPDGILITVRTDHLNNFTFSYSSEGANQRMDAAIAKGDGRWAWIKYTKDMTQEQQNDMLWDLIGDYVPVETKISATITDVLPEGLEYVSSTGGGKLGADGRTITWDISELPTGKTTVTVKAKVIGNGTFVNEATVEIEGLDPINTNKTYHKASIAAVVLSIKKVIGNIEDYGAPGSAAYLDLANRAFAINLSGVATGSVTLKHGETSDDMTIVVGNGTSLINVYETIPMEFSQTYTVSAAITHSDGTKETKTGKIILIKPGDSISITVTNTYLHQPFFKTSDWETNLFR